MCYSEDPPSTEFSPPLKYDWPLMLLAIKAGGDVWGTGFIVKKSSYPGKPTSWDKDESMSSEEVDQKMKEITGKRELRTKDPETYKHKEQVIAGKEKEKAHEKDMQMQAQDKWRVGVVKEEPGNQFFLVTNRHILDDATKLHIYFRPQHGSHFNIVELDIVKEDWRTPGDSRKYDPKCPDVACLPLVSRYQHNIVPQPPIAPTIKDGESIWCAGFPHIMAEEHGDWNYSKPILYSGTFMVRYPHVDQFRIQAPMVWGSSGSLVFASTKDGGIIPLGVFSHLLKVENNKQLFDSSIRVVWMWKVVEKLVSIDDSHYLDIVVV